MGDVVARALAKQASDKGSELTAQLAEKATNKKVEDSTGMYWIPPIQPAARSDIPSSFADAWNWTADQYIINLMEPLRTKNSEYVTRETMGKDASGTYDVWRYRFTPKNYKKTIIIGTGIHGGEITPMLATYRFLYHMLNDWYKYPQLKYIRNNVRIIFIPFQNPWGFTLPRKRQNSNGVDLNRNWDYRWEEFHAAATRIPFDQNYEGTAPFSEVETRYVRDTLLAFSDATAYLDFHNLGYPMGDSVFYNAPDSPNQFIYDDLMTFLNKDIPNPVIVREFLENPSSYNYAAKKLGIVSGNPEFPDGRFGGGTVYNSIEMTKALELFGNIIIQHAREDIFLSDEPFTVENHYESGTYSVSLNPTSYAEITPFNFTVNIPSDGVLLFDGEVTLRGTDATSQNFICPKIGQFGTEFPVTFTPARHDVYNEGMLRATLPFHASIPVKRTQTGIGPASVGLYGYNTVGTCGVYRYRGRITFIPTKSLNKFRIYSATSQNSMTKKEF